MKPSTKKLTALFTLLLTVGVIVMTLISRRSPALLTPEQAGIVPRSTAAPSLLTGSRGRARHSLGLNAGDRLAYTYHQEQSLQLSGLMETLSDAAATSSISMQMQQSGTLVVSVYETTPEGWLVGFALEEGKMIANTQGESAPMPTFEEEMGREVLAQISTRGRIERLAAPFTLSPQGQAIWKDLLSRWQVILEDSPKQDSPWLTEEHDATGTFRAEYSRAHKDPQRLHKRKLAYLCLTSQGRPLSVSSENQLQSETTIHLRPYQHYIEGSETSNLNLSETGGTVAQQTGFSFVLQAPGRLANVELAAREARASFENGQGLPWQGSRAPSISPSSPEPWTASALENTSIDACLAELDALLDAGEEGTVKELHALEKIHDLLRWKGEAVEAVAQRLAREEDEAKQGLSEGLIGVLGAAGTEEAQQALTAIASDPERSLRHRQMSIISLSQTQQPSEASVDALRSLYENGGDDLDHNALLILASMGDKLRASAPERYDEINDYVVSEMAHASASEDRLGLALSAMENLGPREVPDFVLETIEGEDAAMRARAIRSLKRVETPQAGELIGQALVNDPVAAVRQEAAELLANPHLEGGLEALAYAAQHDSAEAVRAAAAESLLPWTNHSGEAVRLLESMAADPSSETVQSTASSMLQLVSPPQGS